MSLMAGLEGESRARVENKADGVGVGRLDFVSLFCLLLLVVPICYMNAEKDI